MQTEGGGGGGRLRAKCRIQTADKQNTDCRQQTSVFSMYSGISSIES